MSGLLTGSVSFVSGGAQGIGAALARRFAEEGARVMIGDINVAAAELEVGRLREAGLDVHAVELDVTDPASVEHSVSACAGQLGEPNVLVANAGVIHLEPVLQMQLDAWRHVLDVNLTGVFLCCRAFGRHMVEAGRGGRIIVTSSLFGRRGGCENGAYSASKFGVVGLAESLAAELAGHGILVNAVCPGQVDTEMMRELARQRSALRGVDVHLVESELVARIPLGRMASVDEVADVFVYLASPLSRYVTGQSLIVDGGIQVG